MGRDDNAAMLCHVLAWLLVESKSDRSDAPLAAFGNRATPTTGPADRSSHPAHGRRILQCTDANGGDPGASPRDDRQGPASRGKSAGAAMFDWAETWACDLPAAWGPVVLGAFQASFLCALRGPRGPKAIPCPPILDPH